MKHVCALAHTAKFGRGAGDPRRPTICLFARAAPGRKSDVNDPQWMQRLHACGLLRASLRPGPEIAALRASLRLRERHLDYAAAHIQLMRKALIFMNLQLHHVEESFSRGHDVVTVDLPQSSAMRRSVCATAHRRPNAVDVA